MPPPAVSNRQCHSAVSNRQCHLRGAATANADLLRCSNRQCHSCGAATACRSQRCSNRNAAGSMSGGRSMATHSVTPVIAGQGYPVARTAGSRRPQQVLPPPPPHPTYGAPGPYYQPHQNASWGGPKPGGNTHSGAPHAGGSGFSSGPFIDGGVGVCRSERLLQSIFAPPGLHEWTARCRLLPHPQASPAGLASPEPSLFARHPHSPPRPECPATRPLVGDLPGARKGRTKDQGTPHMEDVAVLHGDRVAAVDRHVVQRECGFGFGNQPASSPDRPVNFLRRRAASTSTTAGSRPRLRRPFQPTPLPRPGIGSSSTVAPRNFRRRPQQPGPPVGPATVLVPEIQQPATGPVPHSPSPEERGTSAGPSSVRRHRQEALRSRSSRSRPVVRRVQLPPSHHGSFRSAGHAPDHRRESAGHRPDDGCLPMGRQGDRIELVGARRNERLVVIAGEISQTGFWMSLAHLVGGDHGIQILEVVVVPLRGPMRITHLSHAHPEPCGMRQRSSSFPMGWLSGDGGDQVVEWGNGRR